MRRFLPIGMICVVLHGLGAGCSSQKTEPDTPVSEQNIRQIGQAYVLATEKKGPPANVKDLQPYITGEASKLLRSENDGEEFVILWGVDHRTYVKANKESPVIVYEKTGRGGKRLVWRGGAVWHLTDEELQKAPFPTGHKAP